MLQLPNVHVDKSVDGAKVSGGIQTGATYVDTTIAANNCSTCHSGDYDGWMQTPHAEAWPTLMNSGHASDSCKPCHSAGAGEPSIFPSTGLNVTTNLPTYLQNVTCQTCHGPASNHIAAPSDTTAKQENITMILSASLCGSCHNAGGNISSDHHPTYDEWQLSGHNTSAAIQAAVGSNPACLNCHDAWNEIQMLETNTTRTTVRSAGEDAPVTLEISCPVCHDPHGPGSGYAQLRVPVDQLCQKCHTQGDAAPGVAVHHPQAEVRNGSAGVVVGIPTSDFMPSVPCADCHMATNNAGLPNHTFMPNTAACVSCHSTGEFPDNATAQAYIDMIAARTNENLAVVSPLVTQAGSLVKQMAGNRSDVLTTYRGQYNVSLYDHDVVSNDMSSGNHNPGLTMALLNDSLAKANAVIANLTPPDKITGITATPSGSDKIVVSWTASTATDFAKYRIYVLTSSATNITSSTWVVEITDKATANYTVENQKAGTYYVYVTAVDSNGNEITNTVTGNAVTLQAKSTGLSAEILAGIIILIAAIVIVAAAVMMRRRKGEEPKEPEKKEE
jgi:predicted CXXCH cytochrome family protein